MRSSYDWVWFYISLIEKVAPAISTNPERKKAYAIYLRHSIENRFEYYKVIDLRAVFNWASQKQTKAITINNHNRNKEHNEPKEIEWIETCSEIKTFGQFIIKVFLCFTYTNWLQCNVSEVTLLIYTSISVLSHNSQFWFEIVSCVLFSVPGMRPGFKGWVTPYQSGYVVINNLLYYFWNCSPKIVPATRRPPTRG